MTEEPAEPEDPDQDSGPGRWSPSSVCGASGSSVRRCSHSQGHGARSGFGACGGDSGHQAEPLGQGHDDQVPGGDLSVLTVH